MGLVQQSAVGSYQPVAVVDRRKPGLVQCPEMESGPGKEGETLHLKMESFIYFADYAFFR
jgi:hypothetical protein